MVEGLPVKPLRKVALERAKEWILDRLEHSDGLGAIFPPIIWSVVALKCLGYDDGSDQVRYCHEQLTALMIEEADSVRKILQAPEITDEHVVQVSNLIAQYRTDEYTREQARLYAANAKEAIAGIPGSTFRTSIEQLADFIVFRKK